MRALIFTSFTYLILQVFGQGNLTFEKEIHDFGEINETDEFAEYTFLFVNGGDQPVRISNVKATCGCTTPYWTREEILPGDSGRVTARYSTINRPGPFNKSLSVSSNASNGAVKLVIKGQVKPKPRTPEEDLPTRLGALRMKYRSFNMGKITTERVVTRFFDVYNDSDTTLTFLTDQLKVPEHMVVRFDPEQLEPKTRGRIKITFDPEQKNDLGYLTDKITFVTDEAENAKKELYVITTVEEYFPILTEKELAERPKLKINKILHDFKKAKAGDTLTMEFLLTNEGPTTLNIRKVKSNCECTTAELEKDEIPPNETVSLKIAFDTKGRRGTQYKNVTIFSNDPSGPTRMVTIKANLVLVE